jgi:hypothetical protein
MNDLLKQVISRPDTWRGFQQPQTARTITPSSANSDWHGVPSIPTGFIELDDKIHVGGWPTSGFTEVLSEQPGLDSIGLFLPVMAKLCDQKRWQAFINAPQIPYAPMLATHYIDPQQILLVHPKTKEDILWATEQAIRSTTCSIVFAWLGQHAYRYSELRKLQLAAATNDTVVVLFRDNASAGYYTPASLRLRLPAYRVVDILKQRGGKKHHNIALPPNTDIPHSPPTWEIPVTVQPNYRALS